MDDTKNYLRQKLDYLVGRRRCENNTIEEESNPTQDAMSQRILRIERLLERRDNTDKRYRVSKKDSVPTLEAVLNGKVVETPFGDTFEIQNYYNLQYQHGAYKLGQFMELDLGLVDVLCGGNGHEIVQPEEIIFMDIETTGLSLGTGTYVFLVGLGYFKDNRFCVRQFFLRNFVEEQAMLCRIDSILQGFRYLVSFNGKCFDVPLVEMRYDLHRWNSEMAALIHWDLLYPARRIWKNRMPDCRMETLEHQYLGIQRDREFKDVKGEKIPSIYYRYIHEGDASDLDKVLYHNEVDLLTMAVLAIHMGNTFNENNPKEVNYLTLGRFFERTGRMDQGMSCYMIAAQKQSLEEERRAALLQLSMERKREGDFQSAERIWTELVAMEGVFQPKPFEELAKYYEHIEKAYDKAIMTIEHGLVRSQGLHPVIEDSFRKRRDRLKKKREKTWK